MAESLKGMVKWFNDAKGFGFIEHTTGKDVFVHYSVIESDGFKTLKDGEEVEYEIKEGPKGLHAARVARIKKDSEAAGMSPTGESAACNASTNPTPVSGESAVQGTLVTSSTVVIETSEESAGNSSSGASAKGHESELQQH